MALFQGDAIIKTILELGMEDIRREAWILQDIFGNFIHSPILSKRYGQKEIDRAKEFFLNNNIPVYLKHRLDPSDVPCVTIRLGSSSEDNQEARLGDTTPFYQEFGPEEIDRPIPFIVKPFTIQSYDPCTGEVSVDIDTTDISFVSANMILVDTSNGNGFIIKAKTTNGFIIDEGLEYDFQKMAVIPSKPVWRARREMASFREQYTIGCHGHGDPAQLLFIHSIVLYILLRYREHLLEKECFTISSVSSTDIIENMDVCADHIYTRNILLTGLVENTWIKAPERYIESVVLGDPNGEHGAIRLGIHILSNLDTSDENEGPPATPYNDAWDTVEDDFFGYPQWWKDRRPDKLNHPPREEPPLKP